MRELQQQIFNLKAERDALQQGRRLSPALAVESRQQAVHIEGGGQSAEVPGGVGVRQGPDVPVPHGNPLTVPAPQDPCQGGSTCLSLTGGASVLGGLGVRQGRVSPFCNSTTGIPCRKT